jgi:Tol biopolymer transport system component
MRITPSLLAIFSLSATAAGTDVYLFDRHNDYRFVANISDRDGYDNQPSFTLDSSSVLFSSDRVGGQTDIFKYDIQTGQTHNLTDTPDKNEYSAQPRSHERFNYILQEGAPYQNLWHTSYEKGASERVLTSYVPAAYYAINEKGVLFWGRYAFSLFFEPAGVDVGPAIGESLFVMDKAGRSIHSIPNSTSFSVVHKQMNGNWVVKSFDPDTKAMTPMVSIGADNEDYCWTPEGKMLRANGSTLTTYNPKTEAGWETVTELVGGQFVKGGRCSVSSDGRYLAIVNTF